MEKHNHQTKTSKRDLFKIVLITGLWILTTLSIIHGIKILKGYSASIVDLMAGLFFLKYFSLVKSDYYGEASKEWESLLEKQKKLIEETKNALGELPPIALLAIEEYKKRSQSMEKNKVKIAIAMIIILAFDVYLTVQFN